MGMLLSLSLTSCKKDDINTSDCIRYEGITPLNDWSFYVGDSLTILNTSGLRSMAYSGSHTLLQDELCRVGVSPEKRIPSGLGDDFEEVSYASQVQYGRWVIAMYHPTREYPDNFITYNVDDGSWVRWDHSEGPIAILESK